MVPQRPKDWVKRARKDPEGWADSIRCIDLDNSVKVLMDALNGVVIDDDKWARKIIIERGEPEDVAKLVVTVFKIEKQQSPQQGFSL
jgi:crossover junction endodeoxyribonuclease RusA